MLKDIILSKFVEFANKFPVCELIARESCVWIKEEKMTKIKKALLSIVCCFAVIFCCAFVFTACTDAEYTSYNITIDKAIQSGWVKVQGDAIAGEEITIVLNPDTGYEIVPGSLKVNGKEIVGNKFIMPEGNVNVTAKFKKINYAVNTGSIEHGTVDIEVSAQEIASGDSTEWGAKVTLTPVPEKGYECTGITVLNNGAQVLVTREGNKWSFTMPQGNITIDATFSKVTYALTKQTEHGSFTIPATASYGDTVEVTNITADPGYVFSKIIVNGNTITGTSFKMPDSNTTVQVVFKAVDYTVSKNNVDHARISLSKTKAYYGDTITVSVTPDEGYIVSAIKVNGVAISGNSFVVEGDSVVTVELTAIDYSITVNPSENGSIVPDKTTANVGDLITLTVNPDATYKLGDLIIKNGDSLVARLVDGNTVTFTMPAGNVTISATFKQEGYDINIDINEGGSVIVNPVSALPGTTVYLTITPNEGYDLDGDFEAGVFFGDTPVTLEFDEDDRLFFTMPNGNVEVRVRFVKEIYSIDKMATSNGSFETSVERASIGDTVTITVNPNTGYELDKITVLFYSDGNSVDLDPGVTSFVMKGGRVEIFVTFKAINYTITREGTSDDHGTYEIQDEAKYGEEVTITENTEAGYEAVFTVMCNGTPVTVTNNKFIMPAGNVTISVSYTLISYSISVDEENIENGSVSVIPTIANMGDEITITVEPNDGYSLKAISVLYDANNDGNYQTLIPAKTGDENVFVFNMIANNVKIRAWFGIKSSITANEATNGTVEITGVTSALDETFTANATEAFEGDTVTITTKPSAGFVLKSLQVNNGAVATTETSTGVFTFAMPAEAVSVTAEYEGAEYTITKNPTTNGSFDVKETATYGETVTITVTPATGYELDQILVDGEAISGNSFIMPANNVEVSVTFKAINYTITKNSTTNGSFDVKGTAKTDETVTITATPSTNYVVREIKINGSSTGVTKVSDTVYTFIMPANSVQVEVEFGYYVLTASDITYTTSGTDLTITKVTTDKTRYEIPSTFNIGGKDYTVTKIGDGSNNIDSDVDDLILPDSLTTIGYNAFLNCTGLTSITIPNSVTSINTQAFFGCTGLASVTIPSSVTSIEGSAFVNTYLYNNANDGDPIYASRADGKKWLLGYKGTKPTGSLEIPNDVVGIASFAFSGCTGLTSVTIPEGVTSIDKAVFQRCEGLTSITIPEGVTSIGDNAFNGCYVLTSITIPSSVTSIGEMAFSYCRGLNLVTISEGVTSIGGDAFQDCTSLTSITIPSSVTSIGGSAFNGCKSLTSIVVAEGNTKYNSGNGAKCIIETATNTLIVGCKTTVIPSNITSIGMFAFLNCTNLTSVTIPEGVTSIGDSAFKGCYSLAPVTIPSSVTSIGDSAFKGCEGLTSITFSSATPPTIGQNILSDCSRLTRIYVPAGTKDAYITALGSSYASKIVEK